MGKKTIILAAFVVAMIAFVLIAPFLPVTLSKTTHYVDLITGNYWDKKEVFNINTNGCWRVSDGYYAKLVRKFSLNTHPPVLVEYASKDTRIGSSVFSDCAIGFVWGDVEQIATCTELLKMPDSEQRSCIEKLQKMLLAREYRQISDLSDELMKKLEEQEKNRK